MIDMPIVNHKMFFSPSTAQKGNTDKNYYLSGYWYIIVWILSDHTSITTRTLSTIYNKEYNLILMQCTLIRENCDKNGAKVFRKFYQRPYFLPPMVESDEANFLIVSSGGSKTLKVI